VVMHDVKNSRLLGELIHDYEVIENKSLIGRHNIINCPEYV